MADSRGGMSHSALAKTRSLFGISCAGRLSEGRTVGSYGLRDSAFARSSSSAAKESPGY